MVQLIDDRAIAALLDPLDVADRLEAAFRGGLSAPARAVAALPGEESRLLLAMPALASDLSITKVVASGHDAAGGLRSHLLVLDSSGSLVALMEAEELTARRTAAASLVAARALVRSPPKILGVLGAGRQARALAETYCRAFPIETLKVWARRPEAAEAMAASLARQGIDVRCCDRPSDATKGADLVTTATPSREPLIMDEGIADHAHVDLVGGFRPDMREADDGLMARSYVVADGPTALKEAGDLVQPVASGMLTEKNIVLLADLLAGQALKPGGDQPTLFKSVGHAGEDLVAARLVLERLAGVGKESR